MNNEHDLIQIINEKKFYENIRLGHPYHPKNSSIIFVKNGFLRVKEHINEVLIGRNSLIIINKTSVYEILEISEDFEIYMMINYSFYLEELPFNFNRLSIFRNVRKFLKDPYQLNDSQFTQLWGLLDFTFQIQDEKNLEYKYEILIHQFSSIIYFIVSIFKQQGDAQSIPMTRSQELTFEFIKLVRDHYKEHKEVTFYAEKLMISTRHLSNVLKSEINATANEILDEFTLNEAKALLASTTIPIYEIARMLQFSDQFSFSHFFKKHSKISPTAYRKQF